MVRVLHIMKYPQLNKTEQVQLTSLCQYILRPKRGLAQASPGLAWPLAWPRPREPRSASIAGLHQHNRKGKIAMIKTRRYKRPVFEFAFWT